MVSTKRGVINLPAGYLYSLPMHFIKETSIAFLIGNRQGVKSSPKEDGGGLLLRLIILVDCRCCLSWTKRSLVEGVISL